MPLRCRRRSPRLRGSSREILESHDEPCARSVPRVGEVPSRSCACVQPLPNEDGVCDQRHRRLGIPALVDLQAGPEADHGDLARVAAHSAGGGERRTAVDVFESGHDRELEAKVPHDLRFRGLVRRSSRKGHEPRRHQQRRHS